MDVGSGVKADMTDDSTQSLPAPIRQLHLWIQEPGLLQINLIKDHIFFLGLSEILIERKLFCFTDLAQGFFSRITTPPLRLIADELRRQNVRAPHVMRKGGQEIIVLDLYLHYQLPAVPPKVLVIRTTLKSSRSFFPIILESLVRGHYPARAISLACLSARTFSSTKADMPQPNPDFPTLHEGSSEMRIWTTGTAWERSRAGWEGTSEMRIWTTATAWDRSRTAWARSLSSKRYLQHPLGLSSRLYRQHPLSIGLDGHGLSSLQLNIPHVDFRGRRLEKQAENHQDEQCLEVFD
jgi:hypothetical protein